LREICPPKKKTPKSGANIGAIAGDLLITYYFFLYFIIHLLIICLSRINLLLGLQGLAALIIFGGFLETK
jgi:hypothetical protein